MRTLSTLALLSLGALIGCGDSPMGRPVTTPEAPAVQPVAFNAGGNPTVEIDVPGLHCEHCSATACELLKDVDGVVDVKADPETKKATIAVKEESFDSEAARTVLEKQFGEATIVDGAKS